MAPFHDKKIDILKEIIYNTTIILYVPHVIYLSGDSAINHWIENKKSECYTKGTLELK